MDGHAAPGARTRVAIWDAPVRLVHWAVVIAFGLLWWSGETGRLGLHKTCGFVLLALLAFRLVWGVAGSSTARFASFVKGPATVARYAAALARGRVQSFVAGHNPMGGWSVVAMLALLLADIACGLFVEDTDGLESGPLAARVSYDLGRAAAHWHGLLFNALLVLAGLHLAAIGYYAIVKRDDLVSPMVRGSKLAPVGTEPLRPGGLGRLAASAGAAAAVAIWAAYGFKPL